MPIAGALIVPSSPDAGEALAQKLRGLSGVEVTGVGEKGVAVILEQADVEALKKLSGDISAWDEVADFQLGYLNWEDLVETDIEHS
jgi:nitrate reductase NapAB chaperone NapD